MKLNISSDIVDKIKKSVLEGCNYFQIQKADSNLLLITNSSYSLLEGHSTEFFLDFFTQLTGCSVGQRTLLLMNTASHSPFWFVLYHKKIKQFLFYQWQDDNIKKQQVNAKPDYIFQPDLWQRVNSELIQGNLFSILSICLNWANEAPWIILKCAEFHKHICPGLYAGYIASEYIRRQYPLANNEEYAFIGSPSFCPLDALQTIFSASPGNKKIYTKDLTKDKLDKYRFSDFGIDLPLVTVLKKNQQENKVDGAVLGYDWSRLYNAIKINKSDLFPEGGPSNPLFHINRLKLAMAMANMALDELVDDVKNIKSFVGDLNCYEKLINTEINHYDLIFN